MRVELAFLNVQSPNTCTKHNYYCKVPSIVLKLIKWASWCFAARLNYSGIDELRQIDAFADKKN